MIDYGWPAAISAGIAAIAFFAAIAWYVVWTLLWLNERVPWWLSLSMMILPFIIGVMAAGYFWGFPHV